MCGCAWWPQLSRLPRIEETLREGDGSQAGMARRMVVLSTVSPFADRDVCARQAGCRRCVLWACDRVGVQLSDDRAPGDRLHVDVLGNLVIEIAVE